MPKRCKGEEKNGRPAKASLIAVKRSEYIRGFNT
jgi:hypothetical protein